MRTYIQVTDSDGELRRKEVYNHPERANCESRARNLSKKYPGTVFTVGEPIYWPERDITAASHYKNGIRTEEMPDTTSEGNFAVRVLYRPRKEMARWSEWEVLPNRAFLDFARRDDIRSRYTGFTTEVTEPDGSVWYYYKKNKLTTTQVRQAISLHDNGVRAREQHVLPDGLNLQEHPFEAALHQKGVQGFSDAFLKLADLLDYVMSEGNLTGEEKRRISQAQFSLYKAAKECDNDPGDE